MPEVKVQGLSEQQQNRMREIFAGISLFEKELIAMADAVKANDADDTVFAHKILGTAAHLQRGQVKLKQGISILNLYKSVLHGK